MKYLRIKKNTDFQRLFNGGRRVFSPCITLIYFPSKEMRMGVAVNKKHGKAVKRNRIKRLIRESFSKTQNMLQQNYAVVVLPKVAESYSFSQFEKSFCSCFKKINSCSRSKKQ